MVKTKSSETDCFSPFPKEILEEKILFSHDQITVDVFFSFSLIYLLAYTLQSNTHPIQSMSASHCSVQNRCMWMIQAI